VISDSALDRLHNVLTEPDLTGTRYEIVSILGRGGMGIVYLARDTTLNREVALKVLDWTVDAAAAPRLEQEARILASLEHPGIVPVHDLGRLTDGRLFYAMKRVRGERLDRWLATVADVHERLSAFLRICEAVAFAHAHGVIHRDLKPENVMVGEFGEVLVLDWGIARVRGRLEPHSPDAAAPSKVLTGHGAVLGTPAYMAPEQARGDRTVGEPADIFSLGVILQGLAPDRKAVRAIAAKAMSADPAERYASVAALGRDVSRFLGGFSVDALPENLADRIVRFVSRYRLPIVLVATYILVRVFLILFFDI
jgi:eukaryotic-like serine/threonine-protein kinase